MQTDKLIQLLTRIAAALEECASQLRTTNEISMDMLDQSLEKHTEQIELAKELREKELVFVAQENDRTRNMIIANAMAHEAMKEQFEQGLQDAVDEIGMD
jgi:hypothetical protein